MSHHPLATLFSQEERDRLLNTISFSTEPRKYHLDPLPILGGPHIINYSLLLQAIPENQRSKYVGLDEIKNGDILKFSDYRECGTYYCLWLAKDLVQNKTDDVEQFLEELDEAVVDERGDCEGQNGIESDGTEGREPKKPKHSFTSLPFDFQVSFLPKPVSIEATTDRYPHTYPRNDPHVGYPADGSFHLYLFHHLDEYGFLGSAITSMAPETYFQAIKMESATRILLDPLLVHSQSYFGQLLQVVKENRKDIAVNPFFPFEYIAEVGDVSPSATYNSSTNKWEGKDALMEHATSITWTPIDVADSAIVNAGCRSSTLTAKDEETMNAIQEEIGEAGGNLGINLFYEIRNVLCRHFLAICSSPHDVASLPLPLFNEAFLRTTDRFTKFFIVQTSELKLHPSIYEMTPSYYVERAYNIFSREHRLRIQKEVEGELNAKEATTEPPQDVVADNNFPMKKNKHSFDHSTYREVENRLSLAWNQLEESKKNIYNELSADQQRQADLIDQELPLYTVYLKDHRSSQLASLASVNPAISWFDAEQLLVKSWFNANEDVKIKYRKIREEEEARKELAKDAQSIIRSLSMYKTMDSAMIASTRAQGQLNPLAVAANQLATSLTAIHNPEMLPPPQAAEKKEDKYVYPPSQFNFTSSCKTRGGFIMTSSSTRRPPAGFIAYVIDTYATIDKKEYPSSDQLFLEITNHWQSLCEKYQQGAAEAITEMNEILTREAEMEEEGMKQQTVRDEMRNKQRQEMEASRAAARTSGGSNFGFGGFVFPASRFTPPPPAVANGFDGSSSLSVGLVPPAPAASSGFGSFGGFGARIGGAGFGFGFRANPPTGGLGTSVVGVHTNGTPESSSTYADPSSNMIPPNSTASFNPSTD